MARRRRGAASWARGAAVGGRRCAACREHGDPGGAGRHLRAAGGAERRGAPLPAGPPGAAGRRGPAERRAVQAAGGVGAEGAARRGWSSFAC